jgi:hypothetical protein
VEEHVHNYLIGVSDADPVPDREKAAIPDIQEERLG